MGFGWIACRWLREEGALEEATGSSIPW